MAFADTYIGCFAVWGLLLVFDNVDGAEYLVHLSVPAKREAA
jgi:hypothetical protein